MMLQLLSKLLCLVCLHTGLGVQVSSALVNTEHSRTSACQLGMHTGHQPVAEDGGLGGGLQFSCVQVEIFTFTQSYTSIFQTHLTETQSNFNVSNKTS